MSGTTESERDTAALFFIERGGVSPRPDVASFADYLRAEHPALSVIEIMALWHDFLGNERRGPIYDWATGRPLRGTP